MSQQFWVVIPVGFTLDLFSFKRVITIIINVTSTCSWFVFIYFEYLFANI